MLPETEIQCINSYIVHKMLYTQYYPGSTLNTFVIVICVKVLLNFSALQVQKGRERGKKCLWNPKQDHFFPSFWIPACTQCCSGKTHWTQTNTAVIMCWYLLSLEMKIFFLNTVVSVRWYLDILYHFKQVGLKKYYSIHNFDNLNLFILCFCTRNFYCMSVLRERGTALSQVSSTFSPVKRII